MQCTLHSTDRVAACGCLQVWNANQLNDDALIGRAKVDLEPVSASPCKLQYNMHQGRQVEPLRGTLLLCQGWMRGLAAG